MAETLVKADNPDEEEYSKPNPQVNPRNISLNEISKRVAEGHKTDFAESAPVIDDDHNPVEPPPAVTEEEAPAPVEEEAPAPAAEPVAAPAPVAAAPEPGKEAIEPTKEYEVTIDGQKIKVPGQKIIDAGFRTYQKETAADYRLQVATDLLRRAEEQSRTTQPSVQAEAPKAAAEASDQELAAAIQYGNPEEASRAIAEMRKRDKVDPAQILQAATAQARNEIAFQEGLKFVQSEYADLLATPDIRDLFIMKENKARLPREQGGLGDTRAPKELYQAIGEDLRKSFNRPKPASSTTQGQTTVASTASSRQERKAAAPSVPRTAAGRLSQVSETPKAKTSSEIIAAMAARRGQGNLNRNLNKE